MMENHVNHCNHYVFYVLFLTPHACLRVRVSGDTCIYIYIYIIYIYKDKKKRLASRDIYDACTYWRSHRRAGVE